MKRASTAADYSRRLVRVAEHIGENLDRRIELDELAEIACFSVYHFHRIYRAMMGETVHETAMRLRMQRASSDLKRSDRPMLEIARRAGYGSVAAFARAFRGHFGAPPAAFRRQDAGQSGGDPSRSARIILEPVAIRQVPPLRIVAIRYKGPLPEIGVTFERLRAWARPRGLIGPGVNALAVFHDDDGESQSSPAELMVDVDVGMVVGREVEGDDLVAVKEVAGGRHAVLSYRGPYSANSAAYQALFGHWLPASDEEPADAPHYEFYVNDTHYTGPSDLVTELRLPLK
jgi:AraC family transcriptional regulator